MVWSLFQGRLPLARVAKRLWRGMRSYFRSGCDARSGTPRNQETRRGIYVIVEESIASTSTSTRRKNAGAVGLDPRPRKRGTPNERQARWEVLGFGQEPSGWTQDRVNAELQTNTNEHRACWEGLG